MSITSFQQLSWKNCAFLRPLASVENSPKILINPVSPPVPTAFSLRLTPLPAHSNASVKGGAKMTTRASGKRLFEHPYAKSPPKLEIIRSCLLTRHLRSTKRRLQARMHCPPKSSQAYTRRLRPFRVLPPACVRVGRLTVQLLEPLCR